MGLMFSARDILDPLLHLPDVTAADIAADVGLATELLTEVENSCVPKWLFSVTRPNAC